MRKYIICLVIFCVLIVQGTVSADPVEMSGSVVISHIQTGVTGGATQEFIVLYNNSIDEVDITDWCLKNKTNTAFSCFTPVETGQVFFLPSHSSALIVSRAFGQSLPEQVHPSLLFDPTNQSSGSLVGSNDTLVLMNADGEEVDRHNWIATTPSGMILRRESTPESTLVYIDSDQGVDWKIEPVGTVPTNQVVTRYVEIPDVCENILGIQPKIPEGMTSDTIGECIAIPVAEIPEVIITEVLPNPMGADAGGEFIEVYNAATQVVDISGFMVWVGNTPVKGMSLPVMDPLQPGEYRAIFNSVVPFTLVNTSGKVRLTDHAENFIDETLPYDSPEEGWSWILMTENTWEYTNHSTPGEANMLDKSQLDDLVTVKECATNQYRHPETNRCRLLAIVAQPTACKEGQYRSAETNRCRNNIVTATQTPCKAGQERNDETNRCRTIKQLSKADYGVLGASSKTSPNQWYVIAAVGTVLAILLGYAAWEWRGELKNFMNRVIRFVRRTQ